MGLAKGNRIVDICESAFLGTGEIAPAKDAGMRLAIGTRYK